MGQVLGDTTDHPGIPVPDPRIGVLGKSHDHDGVAGISDNGFGLHGISTTNHGLLAHSTNGFGVSGESDNNHAVVGRSANANGVVGHSSGNPAGGNAGVFGEHLNNGTGVTGKSVGGFGVLGISETGQAGHFQGDVVVTGDISLPNGDDCAEDFDILDESVEPGTVMVLGEEGTLHQSCQPYDKRVAGVISGAGEYKPALVLGRQSLQQNRKPIALLGKVFCRVDARQGAIAVGDLLTTSRTPGYAMKADDPIKAFGAVIGKALRPLKDGLGLIPILVALQ